DHIHQAVRAGADDGRRHGRHPDPGDARPRVHAPGRPGQLVGARAAAAHPRALRHPRGAARARARAGAGAGRGGQLTERPRSRRGEGRQLRQEILTAASRLLVETGDEEAVSVRAIADAVGCAPPSIYLHFEDKGELIRAVCDEHFARLDAEATEATAGIDDPLESLGRRAHAYMRFGVENPEPFRVLFMGRPEDIAGFDIHDDSPGSTAFGHLVEDVERCIDAGVFAAADAGHVATQLWAVVHGVTSLAISTPGFPFTDLDAFLDDLLTIVGRGLRA